MENWEIEMRMEMERELEVVRWRLAEMERVCVMVGDGDSGEDDWDRTPGQPKVTVHPCALEETKTLVEAKIAVTHVHEPKASTSVVSPVQSKAETTLKQASGMDMLECVDLIREYHAVTREQIRTLCFLPLWFVDRENLNQSKRRSLDNLKDGLTETMHGLDQTLLQLK